MVRKRRNVFQQKRKKRRELPRAVSSAFIGQESSQETMWSSKSEPDVTQMKAFQGRTFMRESNEMAETKLALDELVVLLGAKKTHEQIELKDFLLILKKEAFSGKGPIIDDLIKGIEKLKSEELIKSAVKDFRRAITREMPEGEFNPRLAVKNSDVFERCRLFAEIMSISYTDCLCNGGPSFRQMSNTALVLFLIPLQVTLVNSRVFQTYQISQDSRI